MTRSSSAICMRFWDLFGLRENNWFGGLQMFLLFYVPIGYLLAKLTGLSSELDAMWKFLRAGARGSMLRSESADEGGWYPTFWSSRQ